MIRFRTTIVT